MRKISFVIILSILIHVIFYVSIVETMDTLDSEFLGIVIPWFTAIASIPFLLGFGLTQRKVKTNALIHTILLFLNILILIISIYLIGLACILSKIVLFAFVYVLVGCYVLYLTRAELARQRKDG